MPDAVAPSYYIGVDGGGTATRARLVTAAGDVVGEGTSGASNLGLGADVAARSISDAVDAAYREAGLQPDMRSSTAAGFGFASADIQGLPTIDFANFGFRWVVDTSDAIAACRGAHAGSDGAILILGTGSQGVVIVDGEIKTFGGWGFHLGDHASGAILGRAGIRAAILAHEDLAPKSSFTEEVMAFFGDSLDRAYVWALTAEAGDYAVWAKTLSEHARRGDEVAASILAKGADWVEFMIGKMAAFGSGPICLMGGLADTYRQILPETCQSRLSAPRGDAMDGAIHLARRAGAA